MIGEVSYGLSFTRSTTSQLVGLDRHFLPRILKCISGRSGQDDCLQQLHTLVCISQSHELPIDGETNQMPANPMLNLAPFGRWALR